MSGKGKIHIGTSGWNFDSWMGSFYPDDTPSSRLLAHYTQQFGSVELNNSFYQLPSASSIDDWLRQVPKEFIFSVKASRYLTHMKKLKEAEEGLDHFLQAIKPLGRHLGPVIFQLPPRWRVNPERLEEFLQLLERQRNVASLRCAFEFRDRSWLCKPVYELLRKYRAALCIYDYKGYRSPLRSTADFVYLRLHGPREEAYTGSYDGRTLAGIARHCRNWQGEGKDVYCYFDNDDKACAPRDAQRLREAISRQAKK